MRRSLLWVCLVTLCAGLCLPSAAQAFPPEVESRIQAAINELKAQNAGAEKDACGQVIVVQAETMAETGSGITGGHFPTQTRDAWGCRSAPKGIIRTGKKFSVDETIIDGVSTKILVNVVSELYFDRENSAQLEGRVTDKNNEGVRSSKLRLVNVRSGASFETDGDGEGHYEIRVPSGEYTVTASADGCSKSVHKQLCAFGQVPGPAAKRGPFRQDLQLDCEGLVLDVQGGSSVDYHTREEGFTMDVHGTSRVEGQAPLTVEGASSQISGEGPLVTLFNGDFVNKGTICDEDGECHDLDALPGGGTIPDREDRLVVSGTLTEGLARLTIEIRSSPTQLDVSGRMDGQEIVHHRSVEGAATYTFSVELPYSEGSSAAHDFVLPMDGDGTAEYHLVLTLKQKEDAGAPPRLSPGQGAGSGSRPEPSAPPTPGAGPDLSGAGRRGFFPIPSDPDEEIQEPDEGLFGAPDEISQVMNMLQDLNEE